MWCGVGGCGRVWGNAQCALDYILLSSPFGKDLLLYLSAVSLELLVAIEH